MAISFIMPILPGPSGIDAPALMDFIMLSLVHFIIAADAGLQAAAMAMVAAAIINFMFRSPRRPNCRVKPAELSLSGSSGSIVF
ncbi:MULTISPECIES: hypothetical protein [unclassified Tardiphaga]|uniref:hypothetical protein n=1 Tax=unclassified Tardiphaga TaxID=2631404 RepID=UPI003431FC40